MKNDVDRLVMEYRRLITSSYPTPRLFMECKSSSWSDRARSLHVAAVRILFYFSRNFKHVSKAFCDSIEAFYRGNAEFRDCIGLKKRSLGENGDVNYANL